jgi:hypothetical protein
LENGHWEDLKANRKTEADLRDMAFDVDKSTGAALELCHYPQNLKLSLYCCASVFYIFPFQVFALFVMGKAISHQVL